MRRCYRRATHRRRRRCRRGARPAKQLLSCRRFRAPTRSQRFRHVPCPFPSPLHRTFRRDRTSTIHHPSPSNSTSSTNSTTTTNNNSNSNNSSNNSTLPTRRGRTIAPSAFHQPFQRLTRKPTRLWQRWFRPCHPCRDVTRPWRWATSAQWQCRSRRHHSMCCNHRRRPRRRQSNHRHPCRCCHRLRCAVAAASLLLVLTRRWFRAASRRSTEDLSSTRRRSYPKPLSLGRPLSTDECIARAVAASQPVVCST